MSLWNRICVLSMLVFASSATAAVVNETQKLYASDAAASDLFGTSVAASENLLVVGAPGNDVLFGTLIADMGAAYVFVRNASDEWTPQARLTPIDGATPAIGGGAGEMGSSVAISGTTVFAGAPGERAVYVYVGDGLGGWPHSQKIESPGSDTSDRFGQVLAVSGERLIVGAQEAVYFFEYDPVAKWIPKESFTPLVPVSGFGYSVAIDGDVAVVGALNDDDVGAAHVYAWNGTKWIYEVALPLPIDDLAGLGEEFGHSVAVSDTTILVSASRVILGPVGGFFGSGKAYLYDRVSGIWQPRAELEAFDDSPSGEFGWSVALQSGTALATDNYYDGTAVNSGRAYVFTEDQVNGDWQKSFTLEASDGELADYFGSWIAASGGTILVGAWGDDDMASTAGAAYVFEISLGAGSSPSSVPTTNDVGVLLFTAAMLGLGVFRLRRRLSPIS